MITLLQLIWGEGYMAPGGAGNVARMLKGIPTQGKRILDIGSGLGGPAFEMARTHGARVIGIDLEAPLVQQAQRAALEQGLQDQCSFRAVGRGPLEFEDDSFDVVISAGAVTQTADKTALFRECRRVLRPGGWLSCYDWLSSGEEISDDMRYWFKMEELTYALETLADYAEYLDRAGFVDVHTEDASGWYHRQARKEYELLRTELYPRAQELLGQEMADHFVENWRAMVVVCDSGEMRQGYSRGRKPG